MTAAALAYLQQPADDRLDTRVSRWLKRDAEAIARARGQMLSQFVLSALADRVAADYASTLECHLAPTETATLLRALAQPGQQTQQLADARARAAAIFGDNPL